MGTDELVGNAMVRASLSDAIAGVGHRGDALLLTGGSGIGKTACLQDAATMARDAGHLLLETAGHEAESSLPFAGLHRLIRPLFGSTAALPDVQRRALLSAFGMDDGSHHDRFLVSVALVNLLQRASEQRPIVIVADDVQWLDAETLHTLAFAARRLDQRSVIVAASAETSGASDLQGAFRVIRLETLDDATAHRLLAQRAPQLSHAQQEWVVAHAGGNPLALIELATSPIPMDMTDSGPLAPVIALSPLLERAFAGRVNDLSEAGRDVVLVAATASDESLPEILAATAHMSGRSVTTTVLEPPQALGLLHFDEKRVTFTHPLVKAAIMQREPISRRESAHRALGAIITVSSYRRAWHRALGTATYDDAIADELEATTADSIRRGDITAAIMALERAAQLSPASVDRGRRLVLAARHAARLGRREVVARLLDAAARTELRDCDQVQAELLHEDLDGPLTPHSNRVIQLCSVARRAAAVGEIDLALDFAYAAGRRSREAPVEELAQTEMTTLAGNLARASLDARAVAVLALADPIGHGRAVLSMLAGIEDDTALDGDALSSYAVAAHAVGHHVVATQLLDRAEVELRARGLHGPLARNLCIAADIHLDLGEWRRSEGAIAELATLTAGFMPQDHRAAALAATAKGAALRGQTSTALQLVSDLEQLPVTREGTCFRSRAQIVRGIASLASGRYAEAHAALSRVFDPDDPSYHLHEQAGAVAYLAESAVDVDSHAYVRELVRRMQQTADASGSPALIAQVAYATAILATDDDAEPLFLQALAAEAAGAPWPRARAQLVYGRWLRRGQRVAQSRGPLQEALGTFQRLGAVKWADEALDELRASGARDESERPARAVAVLSAQESRIAGLAAKGLSNREIGQQLRISPRTVSSHLYRVFPKLGISMRSQIASRLDDASHVNDSLWSTGSSGSSA